MYKKLAQNLASFSNVFSRLLKLSSLINRNINTRIIVARYLIAIFPRVKLKSLPLLLSLFLLFLIGENVFTVVFIFSNITCTSWDCLCWPVDLSSETIYGGSSVKLISKQVKVVDRTCGHPENGVS